MINIERQEKGKEKTGDLQNTNIKNKKENSIKTQLMPLKQLLPRFVIFHWQTQRGGLAFQY